MTASNQSRIYGAANPALTGSLVGVQNGDNITAVYTTVANTNSPVGTYAIIPTLVDPGRQACELHRHHQQRHPERDSGGSDRGGQ